MTLLDAVVELLSGPGSVGPSAHQIWLPPLGAPPTLGQLLPGLDERQMLLAVLGIVDRPFEQRRDPLRADLSGSAGHVAVAGGPRSGKSTLLLTLISSLALLNTPARVQFYILDFGGGSMSALSGLPHVGGVATRLQGDRVRRTVAEVRTLLERREREFSERGIDSIATYRALRSEGAIAGDGFGDVFLVVDGWLTLRQDYEELEQAVTALAARGLGYGIHLVAATNKWSEFRPAVRDLFGTRLELRLGDPYESEIGRAAAGNVPAGAPGRGLTRDGLHFLAAVPRIDGQATAAGLPEAIRSTGRPGRRRLGRKWGTASADAPGRPAGRRAAAASFYRCPGPVRHRRELAVPRVPGLRRRPAFPSPGRHRMRQVEPAAAGRRGHRRPVHARSGQDHLPRLSPVAAGRSADPAPRSAASRSWWARTTSTSS